MDVLSQTIGSHEAALISGYTSGYIKDSCASGKIKAKKIGSSWVIDRRLFNLRKEGSNDLALIDTIVKKIMFSISHDVELGDAIDKHMRTELLSEKEQSIILGRIKILSSL